MKKKKQSMMLLRCAVFAIVLLCVGNPCHRVKRQKFPAITPQRGNLSIAQGKRSGALGNVAVQRWRPTGANRKVVIYELRLQRASVVYDFFVYGRDESRPYSALDHR